MTDIGDYGFGEAGTALFADLDERFELDEHERRLLVEACRVADRLDLIHGAIAAQGVTLPDGRPNPMLGEARNTQAILARLVASLRIPDREGETPQRRGAARGPYSIEAVQ